MKKILLPIILLIYSLSSVGQSLDEAKKLVLYERWSAALKVLNALSSKSSEAAYWQVEVLLATNKISEAEAAASRAVALYPQDALVFVAQGQVWLNKGLTREAREAFDQAISKTGNAGPETRSGVLAAIGRAHGNTSIRNADPDYAIELLRQALKLNPTDLSIHLAIGDCYRRKLEGGSALAAYEEASKGDALLRARANYKIGKLYATQQNCDVLKRYYEKSIEADKNFAPALRDLMNHYSDLESKCYDMKLAGETYTRYAAVADQGVELEWLGMRMDYASGNFARAIEKGKAILKTYPAEAPTAVYVMISYGYEKLNDYPGAIQWMQDFFLKEKNPEQITSQHYDHLARCYASAGDHATAAEAWLKAAESALIKQSMLKPEDQTGYLYKAADAASKIKDRSGAARILQMIVDQTANPGNTLLFKCGTAWYQAG